MCKDIHGTSQVVKELGGGDTGAPSLRIPSTAHSLQPATGAALAFVWCCSTCRWENCRAILMLPNLTLGTEMSLGLQGVFEVTVRAMCGGSDRGVRSPWLLPRQWFCWLISELVKWLFLYIFCLEIKLSRMTAPELLSAQHEGGKLTQTWVEESRAEV